MRTLLVCDKTLLVCDNGASPCFVKMFFVKKKKVVKLWSFDGAKHLVDGMGHSGQINSIIFSPDDRQMISVGSDGCIFVWNVYA